MQDLQIKDTYKTIEISVENILFKEMASGVSNSVISIPFCCNNERPLTLGLGSKEPTITFLIPDFKIKSVQGGVFP